MNRNNGRGHREMSLGFNEDALEDLDDPYDVDYGACASYGEDAGLLAEETDGNFELECIEAAGV